MDEFLPELLTLARQYGLAVTTRSLVSHPGSVPRRADHRTSAEDELPSYQTSVVEQDEQASSVARELCEQLALIRSQRARQARWTFTVALSLTILGAILVATGTVVVLMSPGLVNLSIFGVGGAMQASAVLALKLHRDANDRLDVVVTDLSRAQTLLLANDVVESIADPVQRSRALASTIKLLQR